MRNQFLTSGEKFGIFFLENEKQIQFLYWCSYVFKGPLSFALDTHLTATLHSSPCIERPLERQIQVPISDKCERCFKKRLLFYWSSCRVAEHSSYHHPVLYLADLEGKAPVSNSGYTQGVLASRICGLYNGIKIIWHVTPCNLVDRHQLCVAACSPNLQGKRHFSGQFLNCFHLHCFAKSATAHIGPRPPLLRFLDHKRIDKHTPGRTSLNRWSARRRGRYLLQLVFTRRQWSVDLYKNRKETAIYKRRYNTQNNTKIQGHRKRWKGIWNRYNSTCFHRL